MNHSLFKVVNVSCCLPQLELIKYTINLHIHVFYLSDTSNATQLCARPCRHLDMKTPDIGTKIQAKEKKRNEVWHHAYKLVIPY